MSEVLTIKIGTSAFLIKFSYFVEGGANGRNDKNLPTEVRLGFTELGQIQTQNLSFKTKRFARPRRKDYRRDAARNAVQKQKWWNCTASQWNKEQQALYNPGAFKLDHLQLVKLILFQNFPTFLTFILGRPIPYCPRGRKMRKRDSPKNGWGTGVSVLGTSNWTICSLLTWSCFKIFHSPNVHTGEANSLLPQREENEKKGFAQKWMGHRGFSAWGIQTGPLAAC